ncbi:MAG: glycosyltransferase family 4 protein [Actinobacteria bacterium]|nr:glycosyltransferase family 4 protein [Actinomycetota bacterium]
MKIAVFHELNRGGALRVALEQAKGLCKNNQVDLYYVGDKKDNDQQEFLKNISFYSFKEKEWFGGSPRIRIYKDSLELLKLYLLHKKIAEEINSKNYDVILVHPSKFTQAPFIMRFLNSRIAYYCHEPLRIVYDSNLKVPHGVSSTKRNYEKANRLLRKVIDQKNISYADLIIANSNFCREWMRRSYGFEGITVCYPGIDVKKFNKLKVKKKYDILFLGTEDEIDGFGLLSGLSKDIKSKIISRNKKGEGISDEELVKTINQSRIILCLSKNEPLGLIPLEAMACAVPVIAVNEGGYKETILDGKTGFLIKRNPEELGKKIELLLDDSSLAKKISKNGREHILKNWQWDKSIKELEKALRQLLDG